MFNTEVQELPEQDGLKVRQLRAMLAGLPDDANIVPRFALIPADDAPSVTIEGLSVFQENSQSVLAIMVSLTPLDGYDDDDYGDDDDGDDDDDDDSPSGCERCDSDATTETLDGELLCSMCGEDVEAATMRDIEALC